MLRLLFLALLMPLYSGAQGGAPDISGRWEGNYYGGLNFWPPNKLIVDILISSDTLVSGTSHLLHRGGQYEHYTIRGVWRPADSSILFGEDSTIRVSIITGSTCTGDYTMRLRATDTSLRFDGRWRDNSGEILGCPGSRVYLQQPLLD